MSPTKAASPTHGERGYELGELELAPLPLRPSQAASTPSARDPEPAPDSLESLRAYARPSQPARDFGLGFGEDVELDRDRARHEPELGGLALELDLPHGDPMLARGSVPRTTSAPPLSFRAPSAGAAFPPPPPSAPPLSFRAPNAGTAGADEERAARTLAGYGESPDGPIDCARYAVRVSVRAVSLYRERRELEQRASALADDHQDALAALGRSLLNEPRVHGHGALREQLTAVQSKLSERDERQAAALAARAKRDALGEAAARDRDALHEQLAPLLEAEQRAAQRQRQAERELKRKRAQLQRAEIELRALSRTSIPPPPERIRELEAQLGQGSEELGTLRAQLTEAESQLGRARRARSLRAGELEQVERKHAEQTTDAGAHERQLAAELQTADRAADEALCALAAAARELGIEPDAALHARLHQSELALDTTVERLTRYDRALGLYDRRGLLRGALIWLALVAALALALRAL